MLESVAIFLPEIVGLQREV